MKILDELERLEREATPEPWEIGCTYHHTKDAPLIAAMRNNIKTLIDCARSLDELIKIIDSDAVHFTDEESDYLEKRARGALRKLRGEA